MRLSRALVKALVAPCCFQVKRAKHLARAGQQNVDIALARRILHVTDLGSRLVAGIARVDGALEVDGLGILAQKLPGRRAANDLMRFPSRRDAVAQLLKRGGSRFKPEGSPRQQHQCAPANSVPSESAAVPAFMPRSAEPWTWDLI